MSELVERLRAIRSPSKVMLVNPDGPEAATRIEELEAEITRRDQNEARNCLNWGPCSQHNGRMLDDPSARSEL